MKITLTNEKPQSWNKLYAGRHWIFRKQEADRVHELIKENLGSVEKRSTRCDILITYFFSGRGLDPDNIASKFYIDGLKGDLIEDDTWKQIRWVATRSEWDKKNPRLEIEIRDVLEN